MKTMKVSVSLPSNTRKLLLPCTQSTSTPSHSANSSNTPPRKIQHYSKFVPIYHSQIKSSHRHSRQLSSVTVQFYHLNNETGTRVFLVCIFCRAGHKFRFRRRSSRIFPDGRYHWLVSWPSLWKRQRVIVRDMWSLRSDLSAGEIIVIWFFVPVFRYAHYALFYNWRGRQQLRLSARFVRQQSSCHEARYETCPHIQWQYAQWYDRTQ